jgi:hypothetical protein
VFAQGLQDHLCPQKFSSLQKDNTIYHLIAEKKTVLSLKEDWSAVLA